ncbi:hypothetical protein D3C76_1551970 [compost metagenome]
MKAELLFLQQFHRLIMATIVVIAMVKVMVKVMEPEPVMDLEVDLEVAHTMVIITILLRKE